MIDILTELNHKRGKQIDKAYELWQKAYDQYVEQKFGASTCSLKRLRDYLDKILPKKKSEVTA